eukprot:5631412-Amphidinium_carterae.2
MFKCFMQRRIAAEWWPQLCNNPCTLRNKSSMTLHGKIKFGSALHADSKVGSFGLSCGFPFSIAQVVRTDRTHDATPQTLQHVRVFEPRWKLTPRTI